MITKQFITIILLVLYGVPAAIGPFWHHHSSAFQQVDTNAEGELHACHHVHQCCDRVSESKGRSSQSRYGFFWNEGSGNCSICHFYCQAIAIGDFVFEVESHYLIQPLNEQVFSIHSVASNARLARGPPFCA